MPDGFTLKRRGGITWLEPDIFEGRVRAAFMTRLGGVSHGIYESLNLGLRLGDDRESVLENYRLAGEAVDIDIKRLVAFRQAHTDIVVTASGPLAGCAFDPEVTAEADGAVTNETGLPLGVYAADCVPILLYNPKARCAGAVHAGWRGTASGIAAAAIKRMTGDFGSNPGDILAAIGPRICGGCFETGPEVARAMEEAFGLGAEGHISQHGEKHRIDLGALNAMWLTRAGVPKSSIAVSDMCTMERRDLFWSHRGTHGERGVQAAFICMP